MTKLVIGKLEGPKIKKGARTTVLEKRVRSADTGAVLTMRTIEGQSKTFADDLTYVFKKNVARARRENKAVVVRVCKIIVSQLLSVYRKLQHDEAR